MATASPSGTNRAASFAASDTHSSGQGAGGQHKRTYQACIPCRKRKVKCDLGQVDNPSDPPCTRCRRESKECFFSATRRKKRAADSGDGLDEVDDVEIEHRGGRKRLREDEPANSHVGLAQGFSAFPLNHSGPNGQHQPLHQPTDMGAPSFTVKEQEATAARIQHAELHNGHDALQALHTLVQVAEAERKQVMTEMKPPVGFHTPGSVPAVSSPLVTGPSPHVQTSSAQNPAELKSALGAWSRYRFVRSGLFTAREGIEYVDYFYQFLSPLTPVTVPDYSALSKHITLLSEEPMLAVTILTISSRHMALKGIGALTRPHAIHERLWKYLEGMINRLIWGQEQFGGGLCGAGSSQPGMEVDPYARRGLRTLGTIESLMLLTEWHPRNMHFPPEENDAELLISEGSMHPPGLDDPESDAVKGIGGQRMDTWLEPCWRSDRICWMLLSIAMSVAFEIGVFDQDGTRHISDDYGEARKKRLDFEQRKSQMKSLLLVYMTQTSGRLGLTSMLPALYSEPSLSDLYAKTATGHNLGSKDLVIHLWLHIASIMKMANRLLFKTRQHTRDIIRTGQYMALLKDFQPLLEKWRTSFESSTQVSPLMRHILEIEFEYARVYINSLSLQAVVERVTRNTPMQGFADPERSMATGIADPGVTCAIPPSVLERWYGEDRPYIKQVILASQNLLRVIVEGLYPGGHLRHAPVRTCFRIISVAIILLKCISLGASEENVALSLRYMDLTVEALKDCIADDVHVALRFADLLDTLTKKIKARFVRMASAHDSNGGSRTHTRSPSTQVHQQIGLADESNIRNNPLPTPQWPYNGTPSMSTHQSGRNSPSHPLYGVSNTTYDYNENGNQFMFMPAPTSTDMTFDSFDANNNSNGMYMFPEDGNNPEWLALPINGLLNSNGAEVSSAGFGPGIGEYDMLELMLNEHDNSLPNLL